MKTKSVSAMCIAMFLASCQPPVTFTEPLPPDGENETEFPQSLSGIYKRHEGDDFLKITSNTVLNTGSYQFTISKTEADTSEQYDLNGNTLLDKKNDITIKVTLKNDTLYVNWNFTDTIFLLNEFNPARKFKGHYFLNKKTNEGVVESTGQTENMMNVVEKENPSIELLKGIKLLDDVENHKELKNVNLYVSPKNAHFETCDNGIGFDMSSSKPTSLGMRIMRERAEAIGADLQISSELGKGTCVSVTWHEDPDHKLRVL